MTDAIAAINEFVELALLRHRGALPMDDRWRLDALEDVLRDMIDGARPAPRRISNPSPVTHGGPPVDVAPAQVVLTPSAAHAEPPPNVVLPGQSSVPKFGPAAPGVPAPAVAAAPPPPQAPPPLLEPAPIPLDISAADQTKIREVSSDTLPPSGYTPSAKPCYLEDYYTADMELLATSPVGVPASVIYSGDESVPMTADAQRLLGVRSANTSRGGVQARAPSTAVAQITPSRPPPPPSSAQVAVPAPQGAAMPVAAPAVANSQGSSAIVHMLAGGFRRGTLLAFDPAEGIVTLQPAKKGAAPESVAINEILAIFFGLGRGESPTPVTHGQRLAVKLQNDREVLGTSPDYAPGVQAMTLLPDDRRGTDRIWIPAWSVKEIHFA